MAASASFRAMKEIMRRAFLGFTASAALVMGVATALAADRLSGPPPGFESATVRVNGSGLHYVRGGHGPAIILIHGFPEDWTEYRAIMPRLAQRFTVAAVDLPGIGRSAPAAGGYDTANLAARIRGLAQTLGLEQLYIVGHDLGGHVTYAYVRRFPGTLRGAMIPDIPVPGVAGWDEATSNPALWHVGFIQAPGLAEKLVPGRQAALFDYFLGVGRFTPAKRAYYARIYGAPQLHAAFEIFRAFPQNAAFNATRTEPNSVPMFVAVGEKSFFNALLPTFVEGYRAKGMTRVESARIPNASHYVLADNPQAVAELIERSAGN